MTSPTFWVASSGQSVSVGDVVALEFKPDQYGRIVGVSEDRGLPQVTITEGPDTGKTFTVWPFQILNKRLPRPSDQSHRRKTS